MATRDWLTWNRTHTIGAVSFAAYALMALGIASLSVAGISSQQVWDGLTLLWWPIGLAVTSLLVGLTAAGSLAFPLAGTTALVAMFLVLALAAPNAMPAEAPTVFLRIVLTVALYTAAAFLPYLAGRLLIRRVAATTYRRLLRTPLARPARWMAARPALTGCWIACIILFALETYIHCVDYVGFATVLSHTVLLPVAMLIVNAVAGSTDGPGHWIPVACIAGDAVLVTETTVILQLLHGHDPQWDAFAMLLLPAAVVSVVAYLVSAGIRLRRHHRREPARIH
ncbi:hypothetical protein H7U32_02945 [Bifidobacterium pullorum subsp. saeculare]|uniref:Uncharacterized protein n=1 Tax=Bifidobacterium pullorum subsp. saeculare TaxID=78257 RepID=A0A938WWP8_9BIFI|nr:hypothetical protein [Bifidobacterium pullorum]MBM6699301.1 hypothetical protein [Bifidobacterium pullorum subsp. saeculare]